MKKIFALLLSVAILFAFSGCSKKTPTTGDIVASSNEVSVTSDDVVSNVMPDVESKAGDVVIDMSELFDDSSSTGVISSDSQTDASSKSTTSSDSSSTSNTSSKTVNTYSASSTSQMVSDVDSGTGYNSGWY